MVSDTYEPTRKEKQQVQQSYKIKYSLKYRLKTQKDSKSLQNTKEDLASLQTLLEDSKRLQESWQIAIQWYQLWTGLKMQNCTRDTLNGRRK